MTCFPSQLGQDTFVLKYKKDPGVFLEIGAFHTKDLSNTWALEKRGWTGYCVEPFPQGNWPSERPNTVLIKSVLTSHGNPVRFVKGKELGGDEKFLKTHAHSLKDCERVILPSITVADMIDIYKVPAHIDYMSIDVEGSELEILNSFPFSSVDVDIITVEHNYELDKRQKIKALLERHNFVQVCENESKWDDWFIKRHLIN